MQWFGTFPHHYNFFTEPVRATQGQKLFQCMNAAQPQPASLKCICQCFMECYNGQHISRHIHVGTRALGVTSRQDIIHNSLHDHVHQMRTAETKPTNNIQHCYMKQTLVV